MFSRKNKRGEFMEELKDPVEINLDDIEGVDLERARFIRGYLKAALNS